MLKLVRSITLMLLCFLITTVMPAVAEEPAGLEVRISLHWNDELLGEQVTAAQCVQWGDGVIYWAQMDVEEMPREVTVSYDGPEGYTYSPAQGQELAGAELTENVDDGEYTEIVMLDRDGIPVRQLKLYVSRQPWPEGVITLHVPVRCELADGTLIGETTAECLSQNANTVLAPELPGLIADQATISVSVSDFGVADPDVIVFRYSPAEKTPKNVKVAVICVDETDKVLQISVAKCTPGSTNVVAAP